ncbi:hypothetical protein BZL30_1509 [Mycobacterium kansasii]|uniref:Uncharacterized protein n=1 Tax=Mycobacterium kansasii TaxID=1768 RepID=A0A1V3XTP9_MYCKA|nr:hypothetical protein BZL30_1509 [Mycobacterium kansasii]
MLMIATDPGRATTGIRCGARLVRARVLSRKPCAAVRIS